MTAIVGIRCDGCGTVKAGATVSQPAAGPIRAKAKKEGWRQTRGEYETTHMVTTKDGARVPMMRGYARDICPTCWTGGMR